MKDAGSDTTGVSHSVLDILQEELRQLALILAEQAKTGASVEEEIARHLPTVRRLLGRAERYLAANTPTGELNALRDVSQAIGSSLDLTEVLNRVMDRIIELTGAERAFLMLVDPQSQSLEFMAARNVDRESISTSSFEISRSIVRQVAASGHPIVTTNAQADPRFNMEDSIVGYSLRSILCTPLRVRGEVTGVIYADNRARTGLFTQRDLGLLTTFAGQVAGVIENARLFQRVASAKALMDNVFASMTSGVITIDAQNCIGLVNHAAEQILGLSAEDALGRHLQDLLPALYSELQGAIDTVRSTGEPIIDLESSLSFPARRSSPDTSVDAIHLRISISSLEQATEAVPARADPSPEGIAILVDDVTRQRRLEGRYQLFQRYLSPAVIERLPYDPSELRLGGQRQEITSLFADVRGFTEFSQRHNPEVLMDVLNHYLSACADAILAEEGTLDKFMGDAVVALFNAPLPQSDHTLRALRAALRLREAARGLHPQMAADCRLEFGVGVSVGEAVVGNVGTWRRLDYTAIGASVNLARRLQEAAGPGQILMSEHVYRRVTESVEARAVPSIDLDGIDGPVMAYELVALRGSLAKRGGS